MIENNYLQELLKHTNITLPFYTFKNDYLSVANFPRQIEELINTKVTIKYRNYSKFVTPEIIEKAALITNKDGERESSRPMDDSQKPTDEPLTPEEKSEIPYYKSKEFIVLRADAEAPFIFIGISLDCIEMIVNSTVPTGIGLGYEFETHISEYPMQQFNYIGASTSTQYKDGIVDGLVIRADANEPSLSIIMETVPSDEGKDIVRFITGDEARVMLVGLYNGDAGDVYDFGDLDDPDTETAKGDYDFSDLDEGTDPDTVVKDNSDYDFDVLAFVDGGIASNAQVASYRESILKGIL